MVSRRALVHAVRLCLISGATHSTAPAAGDHLVRAHHLNSFYKLSPNLLVNLSGPITLTASIYFLQINLLLRRSSHNYCCSAPIVQQHSRALVHKIRLHGRGGKGMVESFSREKKGTHRRRKVDEKSSVTFLLCDPGWYVQRTWCPE